MVNYTYFTVLSPAHFNSRAGGRAYLETLVDAAPEWAPEKYNYFEPLKHRFDSSNLEEALDAWRFSFLWRRTRPTIKGSVWFGGNSHSTMYFRVAKSAFVIEPALRFLRGLHRHFPIDVASVHVDHETDYVDRERYRLRVEPFVSGLTTHCLRNGLPDVSWGMLFGPPYIELFGRERLLSTPAALVTEMAGGVYVQLTRDVADVTAHRDSYLVAQKAARDHLDSEAFLDPKLT